MASVIAIGNSKGGVGSTTLALILANYLAKVGKLPLSLIELRENGPLEAFSARSQLIEQVLGFDFLCCRPAHLCTLIDRIRISQGGTVLLDLPGELNDLALISAIEKVDQLIIPFTYDRPSLNASIFFASFFRRVNPMINVLFVPCRIISTVRYEHREESDLVLRKLGAVSPAILEHIGFQRISALGLPSELLSRVFPVIELIHDQYL